MDKMMINVTLNVNNPAEAELIKILDDVKNKSAYLKMAAFHYCNILGKLAHGNEIRRETTQDISQVDVKSDQVKNSGGTPKNKDEVEMDFSNTFDELK
jgi:hypothetical protein